jgi:hypothetical protein
MSTPPDNHAHDYDHSGVDMIDKYQYSWFFLKTKRASQKQD